MRGAFIRRSLYRRSIRNDVTRLSHFPDFCMHLFSTTPSDVPIQSDVKAASDPSESKPFKKRLGSLVHSDKKKMSEKTTVTWLHGLEAIYSRVDIHTTVTVQKGKTFAATLQEIVNLVRKSDYRSLFIISQSLKKTDWVSNWCRASILSLDGFGAKDLSFIMSSLGQLSKVGVRSETFLLKGSSEESWMSSFLRASQAKLDAGDFIPQELARLINTLSIMNYPLNDLVNNQWMQSFLLACHRHMSSGAFNGTELCNTINAIARLGLIPDALVPHWTATFLQSTIPHLEKGTISPASLCALIHAAVRLNIDLQSLCPGWMNIYEAACKVKISSGDFSPHYIGNWAVDMSKLHVTVTSANQLTTDKAEVPTWLPILLDDWKKKMDSEALMHEVQLRDLVNTISSLRRLVICPDDIRPTWTRCFLLACQKKFQSISQSLSASIEDVASLVHTFSVLGIKPDEIVPGFLSSMLETIPTILEWSTVKRAKSISRLLHSLSDITSPNVRIEAFEGPWVKALLKSSQSLITAGATDPASLVFTLIGLGRLMIDPAKHHPSWLLSFFLESHKQMSSTQPQFKNLQLASIIYSLGVSRIDPSRFHATWLMQFFQSIYSILKAKQLDIKSMSLVIFSLGTTTFHSHKSWQGSPSGKNWLDQFTLASHSELLTTANNPNSNSKTCTGTDLSRMIFGLGQLRVNLDMFLSGWMDQYLSVSYMKLSDGSYSEPKDLSLLIYSLARLRVDIQKKSSFSSSSSSGNNWLEMYLSVTQMALAGQSFNSQELPMVIFALAVLEVTPSQEWMALFRNNIARFQVGHFGTDEQRNVYMAHRYYKSKAAIQGSDNFILDPATTEIDWLETLRSNSEEMDGLDGLDGSDFLAARPDIQQALDALHPNSFTPSYFVDEIGGSVNFFSASFKLVVFVDYSTRFLLDGSHHGGAAFRCRLLENAGYRVLSIRYKDWEEQPKLRQKDYLSTIIDLATECTTSTSTSTPVLDSSCTSK